MSENEINGRTHEPSLREVTAELDGFKSLMEERDRLYTERDIAAKAAVKLALDAAKEQTAQSFASSEKAIVKAEEAQREYNIRSNEFRGQLDDQAKMLLPRAEFAVQHDNLIQQVEQIKKDVQLLREGASGIGGARGQMLESRGQNQWTIGIIIGIMVVIANVVLKLTGH